MPNNLEGRFLSRKRKKNRRDQGGRPPYQPTLEQRQSVAQAAAGGWAHEQIAIGLGISRGTLEKHFAHELSQGAYARRMQLLNAMFESAMKGNVAAQKALLAMEPHAAAPPLPVEGEPKPVEKARKGKKEQAAEDAVSAHNLDPEWARLLSRPTRPQ